MSTSTATLSPSQPAQPDLKAMKARQHGAWSSGDYAVVGTTLQIVGEELCEALDVRSGQKEGAELVVGGARIGQQGYFYQPTVLAKTNETMTVVREEIFGPVLCAMPFSDTDLERVAAVANATSFGLAASIWTRDLQIAHKLARRIKAGNVWINTHNLYDPNMAFGGYKQSGWGREMGEEVFHNYTEIKAVTAAL